MTANEAKAIITGLFVALLIIVVIAYSGTPEAATDLVVQPLPITYDAYDGINNGEY